MNNRTNQIAMECGRQAENCLYTSTTLYLWLRFLRCAKATFTVLPLLLGGLGAWKLLTTSDLGTVRILASICSFLAGLLPTIYAAFRMDDSVSAVARSATEFKNLQDTFRQIASIYSHDPPERYQARFDDAMARMHAARSAALTPPEWVFRRARKKVKSGDYSFDYDQEQDGDKNTTPG